MSHGHIIPAESHVINNRAVITVGIDGKCGFRHTVGRTSLNDTEHALLGVVRLNIAENDASQNLFGALKVVKDHLQGGLHRCLFLLHNFTSNVDASMAENTVVNIRDILHVHSCTVGGLNDTSRNAVRQNFLSSRRTTTTHDNQAGF